MLQFILTAGRRNILSSGPHLCQLVSWRMSGSSASLLKENSVASQPASGTGGAHCRVSGSALPERDLEEAWGGGSVNLGCYFTISLTVDEQVLQSISKSLLKTHFLFSRYWKIKYLFCHFSSVLYVIQLLNIAPFRQDFPRHPL